jgi:tight adherence protein B
MALDSTALSIVVGLLSFLGVYLSFDYWYEKIWGKLSFVRDQAVIASRDLFMEVSPERMTRLHVMVSGGLAVLVLFLTWPHLVVGVPFAIGAFYLGWFLPAQYLKLIAKPSRMKKFSAQMVDGLTLMANGMKAGLELQQALQIVVNEMPDPIRQEFAQVLQEIRYGKAADEAFENLGRRMDSEDVRIFVTSVVILRETGGNINETFQNIAKTIRERLKLQNKISAMTAQGMTSAVIVGALPWVMAMILYSIDPEQMKPLFTTALGFVILALVLLLEGIGFFVILKIVRIKV